MTALRRHPDKAAPGEREYVIHHLAPSAGQPPPAFFGVPTLSKASGLAAFASTGRGAISVRPDSIRPDMDVFDHDGERIGRVKLVCDEEFVVDRRWRADIRVPLERVLAVFDRRVFLTAGDPAFTTKRTPSKQ
jgi:hypothetical protein